MKATQHTLAGSTVRNLVHLLRENSWDVDRRGTAAFCLGVAAASAPIRAIESVLTRRKIARAAAPEPPVFVIGHWRTGTTHLHNLLAQDPQFAYVSTLQSLFPQMSATAKPLSLRLLKALGPSTRPMDNMEFGPFQPQEEEFGIANISPYSAYNAIFFPNRAREYFSRYITFEHATPDEIEGWKSACEWMFRKAAVLTGGTRVVSKNPPNTARIPYLLEMFPDAKFVHIFRNPYSVYFSTRRLYDTLLKGLALQDTSQVDTEALLFEFYRRMMARYFTDSDLIPTGNLVEVAYEDLAGRPVATLGSVYDALGLPGFDRAEPLVRNYLATLGEYRPNRFAYDPRTLGRIHEEWAFTIDRWGYAAPRSA